MKFLLLNQYKNSLFSLYKTINKVIIAGTLPTKSAVGKEHVKRFELRFVVSRHFIQFFMTHPL